MRSAPRLGLGRSVTRGVGGLAICLALACGEAPSTSDAAPSASGEASPSPAGQEAAKGPGGTDEVGVPALKDSEAIGELLRDGPSVEQLVTLLDRSHVDLRDLWGPHALTYTASFALSPQSPLGRPPRVGERVETDLAIKDELSLSWAAPDEDGLRFSLLQHNDQEDTRGLVVANGQAYTRLHEPTWYVREFDGELHELWLDDAAHAVRDMVQFAAPRLALSAPEPLKHEGRAAFAFDLSLAPTTKVSLGRGGSTSRWRGAAEISAIRGRLVLDAHTGAALSAQVGVDFSMNDGAGRPMQGKASLDGKLSVAPQSVQAPSEALPMPERHRYEPERKKLLDGLAAL